MPRGAHAAQARALRERLRCANNILTLGTLNFNHFYPPLTHSLTFRYVGVRMGVSKL